MKYVKGFDGLRAISIALVLATHLDLIPKVETLSFFIHLFNILSGGTGVRIFFTISGFLITWLLLNEKKINGYINVKYFLIRRFLKLAPPLFVLFTCITLLMAFKLIDRDYTAVLISFFFLFNFVSYDHYIIELAHTWSLGVEEQFYFFWPLVLSRLKTIKQYLFFLTIIIFLCAAWKVSFSDMNDYNDLQIYLSSNFFIERWFIPACLPVMLGSMTGMILFFYKTRLVNYIHNNYWFLIVAMVLFFSQLFFPDLLMISDFFLLPIGVSFFLAWIYCNPNSTLVKILEFQPIAFLGRISYGVYVYQGLFLRTGPGGRLAIQHFPLNICLVFITATISYYFFEKKVLKYKKRFTPL